MDDLVVQDLADHNRLVQALRTTSAFPHSVRDVEVLETHISSVLLTGEFAYKIKKPVSTGFLDFRTLESRRTFCEEELRLNRRYAPDLYLDVVPITGRIDDPRVGGSGRPLEYAVRMHQFPQSSLLSELLRNGLLTREHIDQLARSLADFHSSADAAPRGRSWGTAAEVIQEARDNFSVLAGCSDPSVAAACRRLEAWTERSAEELRPEFERRRAEGFIRECHGDLHLGNLFLWDPRESGSPQSSGQVTMFDGIEFAPALRWIDVVSDMAFAVMDLHDRSRSDFAHWLQNTYLERTGDYSGLRVLRWYLVYRALVRAKVALLRAGQLPDADPAAQACLQSAAEYMRLGERLSEAGQPRLVITHGVSGSGKTTGTEPLIEELGMIRVRSDVERKRLAGLTPETTSGSGLEQGLYTATRSDQTYRHAATCARWILDSGHGAVVDATFLRRSDRERFAELAEDLQVEFVIVPFHASETDLRRRIDARQAAGGATSEATRDVLEWQLHHREPLTPTEETQTRSIAELLVRHA